MFAVCRNVTAGEDDPRVISWNDPKTKTWYCASDNEAGYMVLPLPISPDCVIREDGGEIIFAEQYAFCWLGRPLVWGIRFLSQESQSAYDNIVKQITENERRNPDPSRAP
jgi:hypothetical protein